MVLSFEFQDLLTTGLSVQRDDFLRCSETGFAIGAVVGAARLKRKPSIVQLLPSKETVTFRRISKADVQADAEGKSLKRKCVHLKNPCTSLDAADTCEYAAFVLHTSERTGKTWITLLTYGHLALSSHACVDVLDEADALANLMPMLHTAGLANKLLTIRRIGSRFVARGGQYEPHQLYNAISPIQQPTTKGKQNLIPKRARYYKSISPVKLALPSHEGLVLPKRGAACALVRLPVHVIVNTMGGEAVELKAEHQEPVTQLRRRIAKLLAKPLTKLVLAHGDDLLHGADLVSDIIGEHDRLELYACVSKEGGPVDELMDFDDPQQLADYMPDLYSKLKRTEIRSKICPKYMDAQTDINCRMRSILVDWLVEVHLKQNLCIPTLFLTVSLVDRYLQKNMILRKRLQLVGVVCMLIASKVEDIYAFDIRFAVYICDNAYTKEEISHMETNILTSLGFDFCSPTAAHFLDLYTRANRCKRDHDMIIRYCMELGLLKLEVQSELPSRITAAAVLLSNRLLHRDECWPIAMAKYTGYSEQSLEDIVSKLKESLAAVPNDPLTAIRRKYSKPQYGSVAVNVPMLS